MSVCQVAISLMLGGRCLRVANFSELRKAQAHGAVKVRREPVLFHPLGVASLWRCIPEA
jgi:hypothetical protein